MIVRTFIFFFSLITLPPHLENTGDDMGKPQAQDKGRAIGDERIAHCPALFLLLAAELLQKHRIGNGFDCEYQNLKQHIAKGKAQGAGIVVDDIQSHIQSHLGHNIDHSQKSKDFLFTVAKEQCDSQLQGNGNYDWFVSFRLLLKPT